MVGPRLLVIGLLGLTGFVCPNSELAPLVLDGSELHHSLVTVKLEDIRHLSSDVAEENPYLSVAPEFVEAIGRSSSQGRLDGRGVRVALYAIYREQKDLGIYGLEFASEAAASRREVALRKIWSNNVRLGRARVHRGNLAVVVVWHDGISRDCWEAVNVGIAGRLAAPGQ